MSKTDSHASRLPRLGDLVPSGVESARQFAGEWAAAAAGAPSEAGIVRVASWKQEWGVLAFDRSIVDQPIKIAGRTFEHGLGTHGASEIVLRATQPMRTFRAWVGMDDNPGCRGVNAGRAERMLFSLEAGGREIWRSAMIGIDTPPVRVEAPLSGAKELVLRAWDINGDAGYAHADWADVEVELADGTTVRSGASTASFLPLQAPFSFRLGGRSSAELLPSWQVKRMTKAAAEGVKVLVVTWRDPQTGLECEMEQQTFAGFPSVEWVLRFRNTGKTDTPLIEDIRPLDTQGAVFGDVHLRRSRGSACTIADFEYQITPLAAGEKIQMVAGGGRPSNTWLPFFNLQTGKSGVITAIGWSGQWAAEFARDQAGTIRLWAGQELTHLVLHPGEEIRTPRMLLLFWEGEVHGVQPIGVSP